MKIKIKILNILLKDFTALFKYNQSYLTIKCKQPLSHF